jgi:hypothetical protein
LGCGVSAVPVRQVGHSGTSHPADRNAHIPLTTRVVT